MERNPAVQAAEEAVAWAKRPSMVNPAVTNYDALKLDVQRIVRIDRCRNPVVTMVSAPMAMAALACLSRMLVMDEPSLAWRIHPQYVEGASTARRAPQWLQIMFADVTGAAPRRAAGGTRRARSRDDAQGSAQRPWTTDEIDRLRDMAGRLPRRDICRELKRSSGAAQDGRQAPGPVSEVLPYLASYGATSAPDGAPPSTRTADAASAGCARSSPAARRRASRCTHR